jgi:hypothetical protein
MKGKYAPVPKTGQTNSMGTRDDGALQQGVAWLTPRFTDNKNGTVTDNLTGLIWMKNTNAFGMQKWGDALTTANTLASGSVGLEDGSKAGDWRLPNLRELQSLVDYGPLLNPIALPAGHPFINMSATPQYWSSTTYNISTNLAWYLNFADGSIHTNDMISPYYVWCVRGGP